MTEKINDPPTLKDTIWGNLILLNYVYNLSAEGPAKEALGLEISKIWVKYNNLK